MKNIEKTNVMRILDSKKIVYTSHSYVDTPVTNGVEVANLLGEDTKDVFKTLVTVGKSKEHYVFVIPVEKELDLKKAAKVAAEKSIEMIKSKEILNYMNQYMNEIPTSFENPHEANYFIFETVDDFIEEMLAQLYYKYKETGIMISFCPDTNINFDEFMFTTDLFAIQEDNEDYIFERISGQGETFYHIYNIKDGKLSANIWRETIEYSKAFNALNEKYANVLAAFQKKIHLEKGCSIPEPKFPLAALA